jgi:cysteinyl-tRNA synthetase
MAIRIYNTLTHRKDTFEPMEPGHVRMYVCGVTVYDECHVGHARSAIVFDVICRYLRYRGYRVTYVRNFTDIDDKILDRAKRDGLLWDHISRTYIAAFHRDMDALGVLRPTMEPLATDHIPEMIRVIEGLEGKGKAYAVDGNVYFAVQGFPNYGKLSRRDRDQLMAGARIEVDDSKKNPLDFALWKRSQPGEPSWDSPWGPGRPGWHIECSAMSQKYLGETFDIHGGGLDLVFPHHENEIAQSEAFTGRPFARFWIHNGPLTRETVKMSKSLGNILGIQDALAEYHPEELRMFMLMGQYRNPLDFTAHGMAEAQTALDRLYSTLLRLETLGDEEALGGPTVSSPPVPEGPGRVVRDLVDGFETRFQEAMDDDFNTALALAHLFELNRAINHWLDHPSFNPNPEAQGIWAGARRCCALFGQTMGLLSIGAGAFFKQKEDRVLRQIGLSREDIQSRIDGRARARWEKNWKEADRIREELLVQGIQILDSPSGTTWKFRPRPNGP